ncbi:MAG: UPF0262 family protein [Henriciella sp.]|nr:UPF0262 family protein [Henriciella sp.]
MSDNRLISIEVDDQTLAASGPDAEHERRVAIFDLIEENSFEVVGHDSGPYGLFLSLLERKLALDVRMEDGTPVRIFGLSLTPFRGVIRDYFMICESYYDAIRSSTPHQIEAIDMARRGIHNEGSDLVTARLEGKVELDFDTARRLFTLICALHTGQVRAAR